LVIVNKSGLTPVFCYGRFIITSIFFADGSAKPVHLLLIYEGAAVTNLTREIVARFNQQYAGGELEVIDSTNGVVTIGRIYAIRFVRDETGNRMVVCLSWAARSNEALTYYSAFDLQTYTVELDFYAVHDEASLEGVDTCLRSTRIPETVWLHSVKSQKLVPEDKIQGLAA
jgi:hypothetical protein